MAIPAGSSAYAEPTAKPKMTAMEIVRAGGRKYSDPDVLALMRESGALADPRSLILTQARRLNEKYRRFDSPNVTPRERLQHLASLVGLSVVPMNLERRKEKSRDAVLLMRANGNGNKGQIFYNPDRPDGRVNFTIAHEIGHTFFPTTSTGARFRDMHELNSREARELENLCDLAAAELLMPLDDFLRAAAREWSLSNVPRLAMLFGGSFEATAFRLATAHPGVAAAGLLQFRLRKNEQRTLEAQCQRARQVRLFRDRSLKNSEKIERKYRRQSFYTSDLFPTALTVRWNKSFADTSIVYEAARNQNLLRSQESLPSGSDTRGVLEVRRALISETILILNTPILFSFGLQDGTRRIELMGPQRRKTAAF